MATPVFSKLLKQARSDRCMTQSDLGGSMSPRSTQDKISYYERGCAVPSVKKVAHICTGLGITEEELLGISVSDYSTKILLRRLELGLKQWQVGELVDMDQGMIARYESGKVDPKLDRVFELYIALKVVDWS